VARPLASQDAQADLRFAEIEHIAVPSGDRFREARGCKVEGVESDTSAASILFRVVFVPMIRASIIETRFIEVKGRAGSAKIALTANEYKQLKA